MQSVDLEIRRDDLRTCRFLESPAGDSRQPGQVLLRIEKFGLTANNITYAVFGEAMSYWDFFPATQGWGRLPVWGFGEVAASENDEIKPGGRYFGYFPASSHLVVQADVNAAGFVDAAEHRQTLPAAYNQYALTTSDPAYDAEHENEQMIMRPLFFTSFLLADFLAEGELFGAQTAILSSASSKTAYGLAFLLAAGTPRPRIVGLTSAGNLDFTESLGIYDEVATYEQVDGLTREGAVVYVDMAGDLSVRNAVHRHFAEDLVHSAVVGATHWDAERPEADLPGPDPAFFFAPTQLQKRAKDWGPAGVQERFGEAWKGFSEPLGGWMQVTEASGQDAVERVYLDLLEGRANPRQGHVLSLG
ncbi:MAG: DUF2855 family protein [Actinomycetota bacterium]